ncbi:cellulose biosynthesis protein CelD [Caulobacter sp. D4A]|uniref:GNAT family N-acetyltransferase n=1 Tax=unclassified Caulobacter TaxID=2648921 RepID=UPI000D73570C|nr:MULTISPECIES: GNAT family N-acetyltransferase [unclassified Caulobacter]PXA73802.1 cellulose biosynthesis protein CelD [Caulobacter sp. D4A]PXA95889.1 cellulose biosynthesis protein CelD [Caulobacter sp. D5]
MLQVETLHPADMALADVALWRAFAAADPALASPLLGPDFTQAVGRVREDARVAVIRREGETIGFLPHHRRPGGMARPIGAPLSDYHGLIAKPGVEIDAAQVLRAADLAVFRYTGLVDPAHAFAAEPTTAAYVIDIEDDVEAYLEAVRSGSPKKIKNYRRLDNKLEREMGQVALKAADHSQESFDQLIAWKREQIERTGVHDFLRPQWTRDLFQTLFETREGDFQGLMINLYAGGQLVAGHFGVRQGATYHPWIASTNPAFAAWSPGQIFFPRAIAAMPELGLSRYDLGPGSDHYKHSYGLTQTLIADGAITAASMAGRVAHSVEGVWALAGAHGQGPVARLRRRMDIIASTELTMGGRVKGLVDAVASQGRRRNATMEV